MQKIKYRMVLDDSEKNVILSLSQNTMSTCEDSLTTFISSETSKATPAKTTNEKDNYKINTNYTFNVWLFENNTYIRNYVNETSYQPFFVVDIFDTYKSKSQNKLATSFIKLETSNPLTCRLEKDKYSSNYQLNTNKLIFDTNNEMDVYLRLSFFDVIKGKFRFLTNPTLGLTMEEILYFKGKINSQSKTVSFEELIMSAYETKNESFTNASNNTVDIIDVVRYIKSEQYGC